MRRSLKIAGCITTAILFGTTLSEAGWEERSMPKRLREEMVAKEHKEKERKEQVMTPEEKLKREEASANRRATFNKWVVRPIKGLKPHRRPGPPSKEAVSERREKMKRFSGIVPRRYPEGQSTDPATGSGPETNVQSAVYTEETK